MYAPVLSTLIIFLSSPLLVKERQVKTDFSKGRILLPSFDKKKEEGGIESGGRGSFLVKSRYTPLTRNHLLGLVDL